MKKGILASMPSGIDFYMEGELGGIEFETLKVYLEAKTGVSVRLEGFIYRPLSSEGVEILARRLAGLRIKHPKPPLKRTVFEVEVDYERDRLRDPDWKLFGILYEGVLYQQSISDFVFGGQWNKHRPKILFTNQLIGTWDADDGHYHVRTSLYGFPNLISIPGLVMGPARPREYYLRRQAGVPVEVLAQEFKGKYLEHGDPRITEVLKGYVLQAFMYHLTGDPFCQDPNCRLFNAHWQEEMIRAQLDGESEICPRHEEILFELKKGAMTFH